MLYTALVVSSKLYSLLEIIILPEAESGAAGIQKDGKQGGQQTHRYSWVELNLKAQTNVIILSTQTAIDYPL